MHETAHILTECFFVGGDDERLGVNDAVCMKTGMRVSIFISPHGAAIQPAVPRGPRTEIAAHTNAGCAPWRS